MTKLEIKKEKSEDWKKRGGWYMFHKIKKASPAAFSQREGSR